MVELPGVAGGVSGNVHVPSSCTGVPTLTSGSEERSVTVAVSATSPRGVRGVMETNIGVVEFTGKLLEGGSNVTSSGSSITCNVPADRPETIWTYPLGQATVTFPDVGVEPMAGKMSGSEIASGLEI